MSGELRTRADVFGHVNSGVVLRHAFNRIRRPVTISRLGEPEHTALPHSQASHPGARHAGDLQPVSCCDSAKPRRVGAAECEGVHNAQTGRLHGAASVPELVPVKDGRAHAAAERSLARVKIRPHIRSALGVAREAAAQWLWLSAPDGGQRVVVTLPLIFCDRAVVPYAHRGAAVAFVRVGVVEQALHTLTISPLRSVRRRRY